MTTLALTLSPQSAAIAAGAIFIAGIVIGVCIPALLAWLDDVRLAVADGMYSLSGWLLAVVVVLVVLFATGIIRA